MVDTLTFTDPPGTQILGTGIIISSTGLVLTDYHVVRGDGVIAVRIGGLGGTRPAVLVSTDPQNDLALLRIEGGGPLRAVRLGDPSSAEIGEAVVAIGNAEGRDGVPSAMPGRLLALRRPISYSVGSLMVTLPETLEASGPIFVGDSGGAIVDGQGEVIGMIAAGLDQGPCPADQFCPLPVAFATPIDRVMADLHLSAPG